MRALISKNDSAEFVWRGDPAANQDGQPAPDERWLLADGQPEAAHRFRVRPLSGVEVAGDLSNLDAGKLGFLGCGDLQWDDLLPVVQAHVGALVSAVTYIPLVGPGSASMASTKITAAGSPDLPKSS